MKPLPPGLAVKTSFSMAILAVAVLSPAITHAQVILRVPTGNLYESSQNTTRTAAGLFDGSPAFGGVQNSTNSFFTGRGGAGGDSNPLVAFDLGASYTTNGFGYSQNILGIPNGPDKVGSIDVYQLTLQQYNAFIAAAPLQLAPAAVNTGATSGAAAPLAAPTAGNFVANQTVAITNTSMDGVYTRYDFAAPVTGEYFVIQFHPLTGSGGFPGGSAFELFSTVPEPSTNVMLGFGVGAAVWLARRRLMAAKV